MTPEQKRLVVHFVKQLQQCIEKSEPATASDRAGRYKAAETSHARSVTYQCGQGKK